MKKILLSLICCSILGTFAFAQSQKLDLTKVRFNKTTNEKTAHFALPDVPLVEPIFIAPAPVQEEVSFREGEGYSILLGSSFNLYSVASEGPNALSYSPDLNTLVMAHRQNAGAVGGSGIISFDVSTDGGATWDTINKPLSTSLTTPDGIAINGNRYPNGALYNPPENSDPNNAYFVGAGAALWNDPDFGNGWGWDFLVSSKLDGVTDVSETYYSLPDTNSYLPMGMVTHPDGSIWYANLRREEDLPHQLFNPITVTKLTFNESTKSFDPTIVELPLNFSTGLDSVAFNPRITFSPNGMIGYVVVSGIDGDDTEEFPSVKPIVWKTTDAGENWVKQARVMYQPMDSLIAATIPVDKDGDGTSDSLGSGSPQIPYMSQFDIVADADGRLHIVASMLSSSNDAEDSNDFGFVWTGVGTLNIFHFITDGENWEHYYIDTWLNEDAAIGDFTSIDERMQASRNPDGNYVFFTWAESTYLEPMDAQPNDFPDIQAYGYRVSDQRVTNIKNLSLVPGTTFDEFEFLDGATLGRLHMMSPITIANGENWEHELPLVYGVPRDLTSDLAPIDYYYYRGVGFDEVEFDIPLSEKNPTIPATAIKVFPNPTAGNVVVDLSVFDQTVDVYVMDMMGRLVQSLTKQSGQITIDLSNQVNGLYSLQIQTKTQVVSKKVMKLK